VSEDCTECGACNRVCQGNAAPHQKEKWKDTECLYCWNCDDVCPQNAARFGFGNKKATAAMDLGRRRIITSVFSGIAVVPFLRITPLTRTNAQNPGLIRPRALLKKRNSSNVASNAASA